MKTINPCPDWLELVSAYGDSQLNEKETRLVEDHLAGCAACREALAQWEADRQRFAAAYAESTGGVALRTAVIEELRTMKPSSSIITMSLRRYQFLFASAVVALIGCVLLGGVIALKSDFGGSEALYLKDGLRENVAQAPPGEELSPSYTYGGNKTYDANEPLVNASGRPGIPAKPPANFVLLEKDEVKRKVVNSLNAKKPDGYATSLNSNGETEARNYGVDKGVQVHYDMLYQLKVKEALKSARAAEAVIKQHGGFTMNFTYNSEEGRAPMASFNGKVPAEKADAVLAEIEKLGEVRSVKIAGEDLTMAFMENYDNIKHQTGTAAEWTKRRLKELGLKKNLVEITASFTQPKPPEKMTMAKLVQITKGVLKYALLAFITLAVALMVVALAVAPVVLLVRWRRKARLARESAGRPAEV